MVRRVGVSDGGVGLCTLCLGWLGTRVAVSVGEEGVQRGFTLDMETVGGIMSGEVVDQLVVGVWGLREGKT